MIKKTLLCSMMVLGLLGFSNSGQCAPGAGEFSISLMVGGHVFEGNQDPFHFDEEVDHGISYGLGLGYLFTDHLGIELMVNGTDTEADAGGVETDLDVYPAHLDLFYNLTANTSFVPYIAAGVGSVTFSAEDIDNDTDCQLNYGLGFKYYMTDAVALRADVRHLISYQDTQSNLLYSLGLVLSFGGDKEEAAPAREEEKPVETEAVVEADSDNDGVKDSADKCPDTEKGATVDANGCPEVVEEVVAVVDSDNDGVADTIDKCADTKKGVAVDANGCPLDSDKDGVTDDKDLCAGTPEGANVDARGCWRVKDLRFDTGKTTILAASKVNVDEVVVVMEKNPELKLEIQGYTDNTGSAKFNQKLSEKRAQAVMDYISSKGIAKDRMNAKGYGIENPAETNDTEEGRANNRRVELKPVF